MTKGLHVTAHALSRTMERVPGIHTEADARALLTSPKILAAANFAGITECFVRIAGNFRIRLRDHAVITVLPAENYRAHVRRVGKGRYG